jgi:hypothetical protein
MGREGSTGAFIALIATSRLRRRCRACSHAPGDGYRKRSHGRSFSSADPFGRRRSLGRRSAARPQRTRTIFATNPIAGFAAFKDHLSYLPHSGRVLGQLASDLSGYTMTKGSLHFPIDRPLPSAVVKKLIATRLREVDQRSR